MNSEINPKEGKRFNYYNIAKRDSRAGYSGLTYGSKVNTPPIKGTFDHKNTFSADAIKETMSEGDRNRFEEETIERQRFMDAKHTLAGKKDVSDFEDRTILKFDPIDDYSKNESGHSTHDSGKYQSGTDGDVAFLKGGEFVKGRGRFTTLIKQNPFQVKLSSAIKIKQ